MCEYECVRVCTYTKACFFFFLFLVKVVVSRCVYVPVWAHWLLSPPLPYIQSGEQQRECVQACLCVCVCNAEQLCSPPQPYEKKEKEKKSQPGGHFEIPGAHLAKPGNWGVYISATEKGKRPDAPLSCVHTEITHIAMGDRPVCVFVVSACWGCSRGWTYIEGAGQSH